MSHVLEINYLILSYLILYLIENDHAGTILRRKERILSECSKRLNNTVWSTVSNAADKSNNTNVHPFPDQYITSHHYTL